MKVSIGAVIAAPAGWDVATCLSGHWVRRVGVSGVLLCPCTDMCQQRIGQVGSVLTAWSRGRGGVHFVALG